MYSVEIDHDEVKIILVDDDGEWDDVEIMMYDDCVVIRQFDEEIQEYFTIMTSPRQFDQLYKALYSPEGVFSTFNAKLVDSRS